MKYLKKYKPFLEDKEDFPYQSYEPIEKHLMYDDNDSSEVEKAKEKLNLLKDTIAEYNAKKKNLENLVMDNIEDSKDISKNIEDIVGENKLLSMYLSIVNFMAQIKKMQNRLEYYNQLKTERKADISSVNKLSNKEEREQQTERLENEIKEIDDKMSEMNEKVKDLEKKIQDDEKELNEYINTKKQEYSENINKIGKE